MTMIRPDFDSIQKRGTIIRHFDETDQILADLIKQGDALQLSRQYQQAIELYEGSEYVNNLAISYNICICNFLLGRHQVCLQLIEKLYQIAGPLNILQLDDYNLDSLKGKILIKLGLLDDAMKHINERLNEYPDDTLLLYFKTEAQVGLGDYLNALNTISVCIYECDQSQDEEVMGQAYCLEGYIFQHLWMYHEANQMYHRAAKIQSSKIIAHINIAQLYLKQEKYTESLRHMEEASLLISNPKTNYNYALDDLEIWTYILHNVKEIVFFIKQASTAARHKLWDQGIKNFYDKLKGAKILLVKGYFGFMIPNQIPISTRKEKVEQDTLAYKQLHTQFMIELTNFNKPKPTLLVTSDNDWSIFHGYHSAPFEYAKVLYWTLSNVIWSYRVTPKEGQQADPQMLRTLDFSKDFTSIFGNFPPPGALITSLKKMIEKMFFLDFWSDKERIDVALDKIFDAAGGSPKDQSEIMLATVKEVAKQKLHVIKSAKESHWQDKPDPKLNINVWYQFMDALNVIIEQAEHDNITMFSSQSGKSALKDGCLLVAYMTNNVGDIVAQQRMNKLHIILSQAMIHQKHNQCLEDIDCEDDSASKKKTHQCDESSFNITTGIIEQPKGCMCCIVQ